MKKPLMVTDWRSYLDWPIADIRRDLGIVNAPEPGTWDWTNEARRG
jgi:ubiquinone biosynthesis protein Coq4